MQHTGGRLGDPWFWSITGVLTGHTPITGHAPTREEVQAQCAEAWRAWLKKVGLQEAE
jgi:hypothetical protein